MKSLTAKKAKITDRRKQKKLQRTRDKERVTEFSEHKGKLDHRIVEMEKLQDHENNPKAIVDDMVTNKSKASSEEKEKYHHGRKGG